MSKRNCRSKFVPRWDEEPEQDSRHSLHNEQPLPSLEPEPMHVQEHG